MKELFGKYQQPLLKLANHSLGRKFLDIDQKVPKNQKIDFIVPEGVLWQTKKNEYKYLAHIGRPQMAHRLGYALSSLEIIKGYKDKFTKNLFDIGDLNGLLNYAGIDNRFRHSLPQIMLDNYNIEGTDGTCLNNQSGSNWNTCHDFAGGNAPNQGTILVKTSFGGANYYSIYRGFAPTNYTSLAAGTIAELIWTMYCSGTSDTVNNAFGYVQMVGLTTQANGGTGDLLNTDYNKCASVDSPTVVSGKLDTTDASVGWETLTANAAGLIQANAALGGYLLSGCRTGWDIEDETYPASSNNNNVGFHGSGGANTPYADTTLSVAGGLPIMFNVFGGQ